jgi:hypothetical protein
MREQQDAHIHAWKKYQAWCLAPVDEILNEIAVEEDHATFHLIVAYARGG